MHFYRVLYERPHAPQSRDHRATLADAHEVAKTYPAEYRKHVRVELVDIQIDKAGVLALLQAIDNHEDGFAADPIRTWAVSDRGGLYEVANGE